jgi:hypothetical protein
MNKIEVKAGESVTFGIRLPVDYDIAKLVDLTLKIGTNLYWRLGDELLGTADVRVFRAELDSAISARVSGKFAVEIGITDAGFGRKISQVADVQFGQTNGFATEAVNDGIDYLFDLAAISAATITADVQLLSAIRGYSAFEIAVQNGYPGTEAEYTADNNKLVTVAIMEKGGGDIITHTHGATLRVITFWDDNDSGRQRNDFYAASATLNTFTLKNDFSNTKLTGTLLCVKY